MNRRINVKPGKTQSLMGFFTGLIFCGIGLFIVIPQFGMFGIFWALIAVVITVTNGINAFSSKGIATHRIEIEDDDIATVANSMENEFEGSNENENENENGYGKVNRNSNIEERLRQLNDFYNQDLITKQEYEQKKKEVLAEL